MHNGNPYFVACFSFISLKELLYFKPPPQEVISTKARTLKFGGERFWVDVARQVRIIGLRCPHIDWSLGKLVLRRKIQALTSLVRKAASFLLPLLLSVTSFCKRVCAPSVMAKNLALDTNVRASLDLGK
ncbi:hypothetical protein COLO4_34201 [Corchorus olitorius]|uniref:Uncharacterized protein n=1 Tax=Corchorus olitorius TaxID=93759 RepID=A0A1R3GMZ6_9ROSI|nr:hypothetical protein COLO4_34201 [Corchorus olitorius]